MATDLSSHLKRRKSSSLAARKQKSIPVIATNAVTRKVPLSLIKTDGDTQPRVSMDPDTIQEYTERMVLDEVTGAIVDPEGAPYPPLILFRDPDDMLWLADGFHRREAALRAGLSTFQVDIKEGSREDAVTFSLGVNANHGKRRTNADKRRAVERALSMERLVTRSNNHVAKICKVSDRYVAKIRQELILADTIDYHAELLGDDGTLYPVERPTLPDTQSDTTATTSTSRVKTSSAARATPKKRAAQKSLADIAAQTSPTRGCLITHPLDLSDFEQLAKHAPSMLESGRLVISVPQASVLGLTGPARLASLVLEHGFKGPYMIHVREHDRSYMLFERGKRANDLSGVCSLKDVVQDLQVSVHGASLDAWT